MALEAKRQKVVPDGPAAASGGEAQLAGVLQRLQGLLSSGSDSSDGLDGLLEELGRAQAALGGSEEAQGALKAIDDAQRKLQAAIVALQAAVDRFTPPPGYQPPASAGVDESYVKAMLSYAHRLSYSSSAPLGYQPGQPLYFFKPPAPQEAELRVSQLHAFQREWEERQQAQATQRQAAARGAAQPPGATAAPAAPGGGDLASMAAAHGLDVQQLLASMPAGWKPGDPIPSLPSAAPAAPAAAAGAAPVAPAAPAPPAAAASVGGPPAPAQPAAVAPPAEEAEAPAAPRLAGIFLNQMDFAELEYGVSSDEEDSEEEDSDED